VQLSKHDLAQLDEAALSGLGSEQLRALSVKLLSDLKLAHERLDQSPRNSSRPPSSVPPWQRDGAGADAAPEPSADERESAEAEGVIEPEATDPSSSKELSAAQSAHTQPADGAAEQRRAGRQPGAPGHGRMQRLAVDDVIEHHPRHCARCGKVLCDSHAPQCAQAHLVIDLREPDAERPALVLTQTKHAYFEHGCACGHRSRAEPGHTPGDGDWGVALSERHLVGARLAVFICALALRMRLSRRRIQELLHDWLGLELSVAVINQCVHESARAAAPVVDEQLLEELRAEVLVHADETGWLEHGQLLWLWVFTSATTTVFTIGRRSQAVLISVLGERFNGWLMSDGYWAYRDYDNRVRCLAHVLRKAIGLEESLDRQAGMIGRQLRECLEQVMASVYAAREGPPPQDLRRHHAEQLLALWRLCRAHADSEHPKTRALVRELLNDWESFWIVLDYPHLPLTNNEAERALRHWVIARRIGYGTRNPQGSRAVAVLASVIETCRQRRHSPWDFLTDVLRERRRGNPAPLLPAAA
jgi:transposase